MPKAEGGCYRPTQPPPNSPLQMLSPVGHKEWPTESGDRPTGSPLPPRSGGEMPKAEGGSVLTSWEREPPSVTP